MYEERLFGAKVAVTEAIIKMASTEERARVYGIETLPGAVDTLNKAWDELTLCLARQVAERDRQIQRLMNELAEAKKK